MPRLSRKDRKTDEIHEGFQHYSIAELLMNNYPQIGHAEYQLIVLTQLGQAWDLGN